MAARRVPVGLLAIVPVALGLCVYAFTDQEPVVDPSATPEATATVTPEATPTVDFVATTVAEEATAVAAYPTPTPGITRRGEFVAGAWVRVQTGDGDCLNARSSPSITAEYTSVTMCLPEGFEGMLEGTPTEADGHWWWSLVGAGYVSEEYLQFVRMADLRAANAPSLSMQPGLIAFQRDDGTMWVMRPDGSEQRALVTPVQRGGYTLYPQTMSWSPDGTQLAYNIPIYGSDGTNSNELHVVGLDGVDRLVSDRLAGTSWSPDGSKIGVVDVANYDGMGGTYAGAPGWVDIATGEAHYLEGATGWDSTWHDEFPAFNHDGTKLLIKYWSYDEVSSTEIRQIVIWDLLTNGIAHIVEPQGVTYGDPVWSPVADSIAFRSTTQEGDDYRRSVVVYDLGAGGEIAAAPVPELRPNLPGKCGGGDEMYRLAWSRDGGRVYFAHMDGLTGTNGVWSVDLASRAVTLTQSNYAYSVSAGPNPYVVFSANGTIFAADVTASTTMLITDGHSPVWSSGQ